MCHNTDVMSFKKNNNILFEQDVQLSEGTAPRANVDFLLVFCSNYCCRGNCYTYNDCAQYTIQHTAVLLIFRLTRGFHHYVKGFRNATHRNSAGTPLHLRRMRKNTCRKLLLRHRLFSRRFCPTENACGALRYGNLNPLECIEATVVPHRMI